MLQVGGRGIKEDEEEDATIIYLMSTYAFSSIPQKRDKV
jgi:hypothetical protein